MPFANGALNGNRNNSTTFDGMKLSKMLAFPQGLFDGEDGSIDLNKPDVILQITANDPRRRNKKENFNFELFRENAGSPEVKMIVLKLSHGANLKAKKNAQAWPEIE